MTAPPPDEDLFPAPVRGGALRLLWGVVALLFAALLVIGAAYAGTLR
jgi:hypothetical protein